MATPVLDPSAEGSLPASPLARLNTAVHTFEQALMAFVLSSMTVILTVLIADQRVDDPESRFGVAIRQIFGLSYDARHTLDRYAPPIAGFFLFLLLTYALSTAEKNRGKPFFAFKGSAWVAALITTILIGAFLLVLNVVPSKWVYLGMALLGFAGWLRFEWVNKPKGYQARLIGGGLGLLPLTLYFTLNYVPTGFSWANEIAKMLTLWAGVFGASICVHEGQHIRFEALEKSLSDNARRITFGIGALLAASFCLFIAYLGSLTVFGSEGGLFTTDQTFTQTGLPVWIMVVAFPIAFGLAGLRFLASGISHFTGGHYGKPAKAEGIEDAEKLAGKAIDESAATDKKKKPTALLIVVGLMVSLPLLLGKAGILLSVILAGVLFALPLFTLLGAVTIACYFLFAEVENVRTFLPFVERMQSLADNDALLAIPLFIMSGAIMSKGQISVKLITFARSLLGWLPGGLAIAAVFACILFAAISGSSPATVVAIGGIMGPALIQAGYSHNFSHGLVTSAGSLGILIPPSIPMLVYAISNTTTPIRIEHLFAGGYGPGLIIGGILMTFSMVQGVRNKVPRQAFVLKEVGRSAADGLWALLFPIFIMGGINFGFFDAIQAATFSVVYALVIELFVHRAIKVTDVPKILREVGVMLGSFLVILVVSQAFNEFLEIKEIPRVASEWIRSMELDRWQFLLAVNGLLLVVGCLMDIMSAILIFVPLLAPMVATMGIDPIHFGIIFIVNLEIGYLTPPVGLNLFVASTLFQRPVGGIIRSVLPFVAAMLVGLGLITYIPAITQAFIPAPAAPPPTDITAPNTDGLERANPPANQGGAMPSMDDMMREAGEPSGQAGQMPSMDEMMREADGPADPTEPGGPTETADPAPTAEPAATP